MLDANAMGALEGLGVTVSDEELDARIKSVRADDLATIVYTSGSTGHRRVPSCRIAISCRSRVPAALRCTR